MLNRTILRRLLLAAVPLTICTTIVSAQGVVIEEKTAAQGIIIINSNDPANKTLKRGAEKNIEKRKLRTGTSPTEMQLKAGKFFGTAVDPNNPNAAGMKEKPVSQQGIILQNPGGQQGIILQNPRDPAQTGIILQNPGGTTGLPAVQSPDLGRAGPQTR